VRCGLTHASAHCNNSLRRLTCSDLHSDPSTLKTEIVFFWPWYRERLHVILSKSVRTFGRYDVPKFCTSDLVATSLTLNTWPSKTIFDLSYIMNQTHGQTDRKHNIPIKGEGTKKIYNRNHKLSSKWVHFKFSFMNCWSLESRSSISDNSTERSMPPSTTTPVSPTRSLRHQLHLAGSIRVCVIFSTVHKSKLQTDGQNSHS